jgi:hypothetical protein
LVSSQVCLSDDDYDDDDNNNNNNNNNNDDDDNKHASYTQAFALQLRKRHGKTSVRVVEKCPDIPVTVVQYTFTPTVHRTTQ